MTLFTATWLGVTTDDDKWTSDDNWSTNNGGLFPVPDNQDFTVIFNDATPHGVSPVVIPANPDAADPGLTNNGTDDHPYIEVGVLDLEGPLDQGGFNFNGGELFLDCQTGTAEINVSTDCFAPDFDTITLDLDDNTVVDTEFSGSTVNFSANAYIMGQGSLTFSGQGTAYVNDSANNYTGDTFIAGGTVSLGNTYALGGGDVTRGGSFSSDVAFEGGWNGASLESTVSGVMPNSIWATGYSSAHSINTGAIEVTSGHSLTLTGLLTWDSGLYFGSAKDTGTVVLAPKANPGKQTVSSSGIAIVGGVLKLGNGGGATLVADAFGGVEVGTAVGPATLDIDGQNTTIEGLLGSSSGEVEDSGAAATLSVIDNAVSTDFAGQIGIGDQPLTLIVQNAHGTLELDGNSSYTGGTTLENGSTLIVGDDRALGQEVLILSDTGKLIIKSNVTALSTDVVGLGDDNAITLDGFNSSSVVSLTSILNGESVVVTDGSKKSAIFLRSSFTQAQLGILDVTSAGVILSPYYNYSGGGALLDVGGNGETATPIVFFASKDTIDLLANSNMETTGADDTVNAGASDSVDILGGGETVFGQTNDTAYLGGGSGWDTFEGGSSVVKLYGAQISVVGGGDAVYSESGSNEISFYNTGSVWDAAYIDDGLVILTNSKVSLLGKGDTAYFLGASGDALSLYDTNNDWDTVYGSNGSVTLSGSQASVLGGGDTIYFSNAAGDAVSLYDTKGDGDKVVGSGANIVLTSAQASVTGDNDAVYLNGGDNLTVSGTSETFEFQAAIGQTTINGYSLTDTIDLSLSDFSSWSVLHGDIAQSGANTTITLNASNQIVLVDVVASTLTSAQFHLA